jgi:hypothetical protein
MCRLSSTSQNRRAREVNGLTGLETRINQAPGVSSHTNPHQPRHKPLSDSCDDLYIVSHNDNFRMNTRMVDTALLIIWLV